MSGLQDPAMSACWTTSWPILQDFHSMYLSTFLLLFWMKEGVEKGYKRNMKLMNYTENVNFMGECSFNAQRF